MAIIKSMASLLQKYRCGAPRLALRAVVASAHLTPVSVRGARSVFSRVPAEYLRWRASLRR